MQSAAVFVFCVLVCVLCASFTAFDGTDKALRASLGIMLLSAVLSAVLSIPEPDITVGDIPNHGAEYVDTAEGVLLSAFERGVSASVADHFGLSADDIDAQAVGFCAEELNAERIELRLSGMAALADTKKICEYVESSGLGKCTAEVRFD